MQVHFGATDPRRSERVIAAFAVRVRKARSIFTGHVYSIGMHHFADPQWAGYDVAAATLMFERVLAFVAGTLGG